MSLAFCTDLAAADWIAAAELPWQQLVCFGPAGFEAYGRLRFLPDPARPGQSENEVAAEPWRDEQLPRLFEALAAYTGTPDDCYFCVWEGFGSAEAEVADVSAYAKGWDPDARPGQAPGGRRDGGPRVVLPHREYWLFRGPLGAVGAWDTARGRPGTVRLGGAEPAFVWPADRAWCFADDVDPHFAGIGGPAALIDRLIADPRLDVVAADPAAPQPAYR